MKISARLVMMFVCVSCCILVTTPEGLAYKSVSVVEEKVAVYKTGSNTDLWCVVAIESRYGQPTLYEYDAIEVEHGKASRRLMVPLDAEFFVVVDDGAPQKIKIPTYCRRHNCILHNGRIKVWDIQLNIDDDKRVTVGPLADCCL